MDFRDCRKEFTTKLGYRKRKNDFRTLRRDKVYNPYVTITIFKNKSKISSGDSKN